MFNDRACRRSERLLLPRARSTVSHWRVVNAEAFDERLAADAGAAMFDVAERIIKAMRAVAGTVAAQHLSYGDAVFAECMGEVDTPARHQRRWSVHLVQRPKAPPGPHFLHERELLTKLGDLLVEGDELLQAIGLGRIGRGRPG